MLCLQCGHDESGLGPACSECDAYVGVVAEGRGYLPQLKRLEQSLERGEVDAGEAQERLERAREALDTMMGVTDQTGHELMTLEWDDVQQGTLAGFLAPMREGLEKLRDLVSELDVQGGWGESTWARLDEAQSQVQRGNEGVLSLVQELVQVAQQQGL